MNYNVYLLLILIFSSVHTLIASNKKIVTGDIKYVCTFFRSKDYSIDDVLMPDILTFCSCSVVHKNWALTSRQCFVQMDWFLSVVIAPFTNKLPKKLHSIQNIYDNTELSLIRVSPEFEYKPIVLSTDILHQATNCTLFGFSTPDDKPIKGNDIIMIYKVWHMEGNLLQTEVEAMYYKDCEKKFLGALTEYKLRITLSTLCLNPIGSDYVEPCAFDRGAPIVCNGHLQAVLMYTRPLPHGVPLHLPTGCYGNINSSYSMYAESMTPAYTTWINNMLKSV